MPRLEDHLDDALGVDLRVPDDTENIVTDDNYPPFDGNAEFLDAWTLFLKMRRLRVEAEMCPVLSFKRPTKAVEPDIPIGDLYDREKAAWADLQARLAAHRADDAAPALGLEVLRVEHGLDDNEQIIVVALALVAISETLAAETLGDMASGFGMTINSLMLLLAPEQSPWQIEDWLNWRSYFRPEAKLVVGGVIRVDRSEDDGPADLPGSWVSVTAKGFRGVTGVTP